MAKLGQFILQKGNWNGQQLLPEAWFEVATSARVPSVPAGVKEADLTPPRHKKGDWVLGYGYQMWRSRHNSFRADGARGQFILVLPEKNAVIVMTADIDDTQTQLDMVWDYLLPALK